MKESSVAELLRVYGKWIRREDFIKLIGEKRSVGERQAYKLIKKSFENKEILKHLLSDRTTLYGLAEFGPYQFAQTLEVPTSKDKPSKVGILEYFNLRAERKLSEKNKQNANWLVNHYGKILLELEVLKNKGIDCDKEIQFFIKERDAHLKVLGVDMESSTYLK